MPGKQNKSNKNMQGGFDNPISRARSALSKTPVSAPTQVPTPAPVSVPATLLAADAAAASNQKFDAIGFDMTQSSTGLLTATTVNDTNTCAPNILFCLSGEKRKPNVEEFTKNLQYLDLCLKMIREEVRLKKIGEEDETKNIEILSGDTTFGVYIKATNEGETKGVEYNESGGHLSPFVMIAQLYAITNGGKFEVAGGDIKFSDGDGIDSNWQNWHALIIERMGESPSETTANMAEKLVDPTPGAYETFLNGEYKNAYKSVNDKKTEALGKSEVAIANEKKALADAADAADAEAEEEKKALADAAENRGALNAELLEQANAKEETVGEKAKKEYESRQPIGVEEAQIAVKEAQDDVNNSPNDSEKINTLEEAKRALAEKQGKKNQGGKSKNQTFKRKNASQNKSKRRYTYGGRKAHNQRKQSRKDKQKK